MSESPLTCEGCFYYGAVPEAGATIGAPVCNAGMGPIGMVSSSRSDLKKIAEVKAKSCEKYKASGSSIPDDAIEGKASGTIVMLPSPKVRPGETGASLAPHSCISCKYFVTPTEIMSAGLWNAGVCAKRGILIERKSTVSIGEKCEYGEIGVREDWLKEMTLAPNLTVIGDLTPVDDFARSATSKFIEPTEYETDKPVTDEEKESGIRAWRRVQDVDGFESEVYLPIFNIDFFEEELRKSIPRTGDDEHPEEYVDHAGLAYKAAVLWMYLGETPSLVGQAGTGKTEFFRYMAWLMCIPFQRISVTASTEVEDLAGKMHYDPSRGTYFEYGRIPSAWMKPGVICLDEPNVGPPDVWQFIRPLTDNSKQLVLDMNNGERVSRHPHAFLGMAMNPAWDVRNSGANTLADADGSRLMHIFVQLPDEKTERQIITDRCRVDGYALPVEKLDAIMKIADDLRKMSENDTLEITWGIRQQIKVARATQYFKLATAYRLAAADYLAPQQQEIVLSVVKTHESSVKKAAAVHKARRARFTSGGVIDEMVTEAMATPFYGISSKTRTRKSEPYPTPPEPYPTLPEPPRPYRGALSEIEPDVSPF